MPKPKLPDKEFKWISRLAYVTGLLATDGNLSGDKRHIIMRSSDIQLLKTFKKCLNLSVKIGVVKSYSSTRKRSYRVQFGDVQFYRWLLKIGLFPAKTYTIGKIKVPDIYFRDFLRGHLDGDGSISTYKDYYNTFKNPKYVYIRLWVKFISMSKNHIIWLREKIYKLIQIKGHLIQAKNYHSDKIPGMAILKFGKKESIKLLKWIYYKPNLPCLLRKRQIAEKFLKA
jgi:hypothetical protein